MDTYRHEKTQTQYAVFKNGGGLVSYDDARAICDKVHYANERGMHGCKLVPCTLEYSFVCVVRVFVYLLPGPNTLNYV